MGRIDWGRVVFDGRRWVGSLRYDPPEWWGHARERAFVAGAELRARAAAADAWDARTAAVVVGCMAVPFFALRALRGNAPAVDAVTASVAAPAAMKLEAGAKPDVLRVSFSGPAAPLKDIGKKIGSGIRLEPSPGGAWAWVSDRELVFTPERDWDVGRAYELRL